MGTKRASQWVPEIGNYLLKQKSPELMLTGFTHAQTPLATLGALLTLPPKNENLPVSWVCPSVSSLERRQFSRVRRNNSVQSAEQPSPPQSPGEGGEAGKEQPRTTRFTLASC